MSSEYPTLRVALPIEETKKKIQLVTQTLHGKLEEEGNHLTLKAEFDQKLNEEQLDAKLTLAASEQFKSKGFMLLWIGAFLVILSILGTVSARFRQADADKNEIYYTKDVVLKIQLLEESKKDPKELERLKLSQEAGLLDVADDRRKAKITYMAIGGSFSTALLLFFLSYRSKVIRARRTEEIKNELLREMSEGGKDPYQDHRKDSLALRLFPEGEQTDIIFESEEGTTLMIYMVGLLIEECKKHFIANAMEGQIASGNSPLEDILESLRESEILGIELDKKVLNFVEF